jgi:hypothetical protein
MLVNRSRIERETGEEPGFGDSSGWSAPLRTPSAWREVPAHEFSDQAGSLSRFRHFDTMTLTRHHQSPRAYVTFENVTCSLANSCIGVSLPLPRATRFWHADCLAHSGQHKRSEARCGDVPVGLSILFSHYRCDDPGRKKDVERSCCFGR